MLYFYQVAVNTASICLNRKHNKKTEHYKLTVAAVKSDRSSSIVYGVRFCRLPGVFTTHEENGCN